MGWRVVRRQDPPRAGWLRSFLRLDLKFLPPLCCEPVNILTFPLLCPMSLSLRKDRPSPLQPLPFHGSIAAGAASA